MKKLLYGCITFALLAAGTCAVACGNCHHKRNCRGLSTDWTGYYFGLHAGYGWGDQSVNQTGSTLGPGSVASAISAGAIPGSLASNPSGALGGAEFGYNFQLNYLAVFGVVTDFDWAHIRARETITTTKPGFANFTTYAQQNIQSLGTLRLLVGVTPYNYPVLVYATGGGAYGFVKTNASISNPGCTFFCGSNSISNTNLGWVGGAGLAYNIDNEWSAKVEYLYYNLGSQSQSITDPAFPGSYLAQNVSYTGNLIRAGIDYKFG